MLPETYWALVESILYSSWYLGAAHMDTDRHELGESREGGGRKEGEERQGIHSGCRWRLQLTCIMSQHETEGAFELSLMAVQQKKVGSDTVRLHHIAPLSRLLQQGFCQYEPRPHWWNVSSDRCKVDARQKTSLKMTEEHISNQCKPWGISGHTMEGGIAGGRSRRKGECGRPCGGCCRRDLDPDKYRQIQWIIPIKYSYRSSPNE